HVVGLARHEAKADHVEEQPLAGLADRGRKRGRLERSDLLRERLRDRPLPWHHAFRTRGPPPRPGTRLAAAITAEVRTSMVRPSTAMAARSPPSVRSKIRTASTLVSEVKRIAAADSSRTTATKTKHQVAISEGPSRGAVTSRKVFSRDAPRMRLASSSSGASARKEDCSCWYAGGSSMVT